MLVWSRAGILEVTDAAFTEPCNMFTCVRRTLSRMLPMRSMHIPGTTQAP